MTRPTASERARPPEPRPTASATIEPLGPPSPTPRSHAVRLYLAMSAFEHALADRRSVLRLAEAAIRALDAGSAPCYFDIVTREKVVGIEATFTTSGVPSTEAIASMRDSLASAGYAVSVRLVRECADAGCTTTTSADPSRSPDVPYGWHSAAVCGRHGYRRCPSCASLYVMTSSSSTGQAPAVHCDVCGTVLVEWGGSKRWTAELVTRGRGP